MNAEYAVMVGLDRADQKHDLCWRDTQTGKVHTLVLEQRPERINEWVCKLMSKHPEGRIAVCLEQSRGAVVYALMGYAAVDLYPINPVTLAKYRKAFCPSGAKDDPSDAALMLELLERHSEALRLWRPDTEETRLLSPNISPTLCCGSERHATCGTCRRNANLPYVDTAPSAFHLQAPHLAHLSNPHDETW